MLTNLGASLRRWRRRLSRSEWAIHRLNLERDAAPSHAPGLLLIQVDGLSRAQFEQAIDRGRMPFLARFLRRDGGKVHTFYSGLPASTPAVQAELHYGVRGAVPAFSFLDPRADGIGAMMNPDWAKRIEAELARNHEGLLTGGSSWSNIYTGGATQEESHFCAASIGLGDLWRTGKLTNILLFVFLHTPSVLRLLALLPVELVLSLIDATRGILAGRDWRRELIFIGARVSVCIGLRELITLGTKIDLARGLPIIHVNYLGYDEQSHRRGPGSLFAHWTLRGIDRAIRQLHRAARRSNGRDYEVWIFSDHGQIRSRPLHLDVPGGLQGLVHRHWPGLATGARVPPRETRLNYTHASLLGGPGRARRAFLDSERAKLSPFESSEFAVACMGPVGHIYCKRDLSPESLEQLVTDLLAGGVPGILRKRGDAVEWRTVEGMYSLPHDTTALRGPRELRAELAEDLVRLVRHRCAGDLVALGWHPNRPAVTFANESGSHCGPSPEEIQGFLLVPPASEHLISGEIVRPSALRSAALHHLGRSPRPTSHPRPPRASGRLRVVTYNVHYCKGLDGRFSPDRIARVLRALDPDIIALQEIESGRPRSRHEDQLAFLAKELGLEACFCVSIERGEERYGHAFLARHSLIHQRCIHLPNGGRPRIEPRDVMAAKLKWHGREITLVGTHLGLAPAERAAQIDRLLQPDLLGGEGPTDPTIFLGDLNVSPGGALYRRLVTPWAARDGIARFRDVQAHAPRHVACKTFPSFLPMRRLDHIFVSPHFSVHAVFAPANLLTRRASDHLPLVADLELHA